MGMAATTTSSAVRLQDKLYGGAGDELFDGGLDDDLLYGDAGDDVLVYRPTLAMETSTLVPSDLETISRTAVDGRPSHRKPARGPLHCLRLVRSTRAGGLVPTRPRAQTTSEAFTH